MTARILFVDRDGTLVEEPHDRQLDDLAKIRLLPDVIPSLLSLRRAGFRLVMVTNQDGRGTPSFPEERFFAPHRFLLDLFASQGVLFDEVFVCPHLPADGCACRKPKTGLVDDFVRRVELDRASSAVIGDRETDLEFAQNLGIRGLRVRVGGSEDETWAGVVRLLGRSRAAMLARTTKETCVRVAVDLDREAPITVSTGIGFFDHMLEQIARHGGFSLDLECKGDLHVDEHHTVEDSALALGEALRRALGDRRGVARFGFLLPMDEAEARVALDLSGRPFAKFEGKFARESVGGLPTELVPHFFRSLAESLGAALHVEVRGENTHHMIEACFKGVGRALRQAFRVEGADVPSTKGVLA